jgi:monolysocardiolipin acyltransferase
MALSRDEERALSRWRSPSNNLYNRALAVGVIATSRLIMRVMNRLKIENEDVFDETQATRGERGLLSFSNHVSIFDDPLLIANLKLGPYAKIRWIAADALNFFGSPLKAHIFNAGKAVPIVRGAGIDQPGFFFLRDRLKEGGWVHIFPEGGRTRDPLHRLSAPFRAGVGRLIAEANPIALPIYHYGMHQVLPRGAKLPRFGKRVRMVIGEPIDFSEGGSDESVGASELRPAEVWEALTTRCYEALRQMESRFHPDALRAG